MSKTIRKLETGYPFGRSIYNSKEFRSIDCNCCNKVCGNYPAYKRHMWKKHKDWIKKEGNTIKNRPYDLDKAVDSSLLPLER